MVKGEVKAGYDCRFLENKVVIIVIHNKRCSKIADGIERRKLWL